MTDKLPPNLLTLFTARPALRYLPPSDYAPEDRTTSKISGVAQFVGHMKDYEEIPYEPTESWLQRKERVKAEKRARLEDLRSNVEEKCRDPKLMVLHSYSVCCVDQYVLLREYVLMYARVLSSRADQRS